MPPPHLTTGLAPQGPPVAPTRGKGPPQTHPGTPERCWSTHLSRGRAGHAQSALALPPWAGATPVLSSGSLWAGTPRSPVPTPGTQSSAKLPEQPRASPAPPAKPKTTYFCLFLSPPREVSSHQMLPGSPSKGKRPPHPMHLLNQSEQCRAGGRERPRHPRQGQGQEPSAGTAVTPEPGRCHPWGHGGAISQQDPPAGCRTPPSTAPSGGKQFWGLLHSSPSQGKVQAGDGERNWLPVSPVCPSWAVGERWEASEQGDGAAAPGIPGRGGGR